MHRSRRRRIKSSLALARAGVSDRFSPPQPSATRSRYSRSSIPADRRDFRSSRSAATSGLASRYWPSSWRRHCGSRCRAHRPTQPKSEGKKNWLLCRARRKTFFPPAQRSSGTLQPRLRKERSALFFLSPACKKPIIRARRRGGKTIRGLLPRESLIVHAGFRL